MAIIIPYCLNSYPMFREGAELRRPMVPQRWTGFSIKELIHSGSQVKKFFLTRETLFTGAFESSSKSFETYMENAWADVLQVKSRIGR